MVIPKLKSTLTSSDGFVWYPKTVRDCLVELEHIKNSMQGECCYFRGHRCSNWLLDSTVSRNMKKKRGMKDTQRYSLEERSNTALQHKLGNEVYDNICSIPKLRKTLSEPTYTTAKGYPIDVIFEYIRHIQQNPKDPNLSEFRPLRTNFLDFSLSRDVGLFFANRNRLQSDEGALFVVQQRKLGEVFYRGNTPFKDIFLQLKQILNQSPQQ